MSDFHLGLLFGVIFAIGVTGLVMLALGRKSKRRGVLLLTISVALGFLAGCVFFQPDPPQLESSWKELFAEKSNQIAPRVTLYTDTGRAITVVVGGEDDCPTEEILAQEESLAQKYPFTLIRTAGPHHGSNCFGWVFTGGRYWINGLDVDNILVDNGYHKVYEPHDGDVIIYRGKIGDVIHAAIVRSAGDLVMIEGKWSNLGVYMHAPNQYPFSQSYDYYRSDRKGHLLNLPE